MQTPSGTNALDVKPKEERSLNEPLESEASIQKIVRFDLREEGSHTLAVNVSYSETTIAGDQSASSGRVRTFRKLYQFAARPCLNVRTKVSSLPTTSSERAPSEIVEVQLENMADGTIILQKIAFNSKPAFKSTSLNWDLARPDTQHVDCPIMAPRDVMQIAFLLEQKIDGPSKELTKDGRAILGTLGIQWRTTMGDCGFLSTGWLTTKRR
ncbi:trafficking protein particle complex subunit 13, partial [Lecanoromycetidae sp. Uapishka_2]